MVDKQSESSFDDFIAFGNKKRTLEFLNLVKNYSYTSPGSNDWIRLCDPNILRKNGTSLPPLYADCKDIFGANYNVNLNDHIGWFIFLRGFFDPTPTLIAKYLGAIGHGGIYIDGGANIGTTSIPLALAGTEVLGIEASNSTCAELLKNYSLNPSIKATVINAALCSPSQVRENRHSEIFRSEGNFAAGSLYDNWNNLDGKKFKEYAFNTTLDKVVTDYQVQDILLLKLDIEGYEYFALEGFQATLQSMQPPVMFEWRPDLLMKTLGRVDDLRVLFPSSYQFYSVKYKKLKGEGTAKFGIHLQATDLSQPAENVLAICDKYFSNEILENLQSQYVLVD